VQDRESLEAETSVLTSMLRSQPLSKQSVSTQATKITSIYHNAQTVLVAVYNTEPGWFTDSPV